MTIWKCKYFYYISSDYDFIELQH